MFAIILGSMLLGIDIGGTKTLVALFDDSGHIIRQEKFPTNHDFDAWSAEVVEHIKQLLGTDTVQGIGVAAPGQIDYENGVGLIFGNLPWRNVPIKQALNQALAVPVAIENDANAAGLAEARELDPPPSSLVYITVSTGIGTGIITDNRVDPHFQRSEGGFMHFEKDGALLPWEKFASGHALADKYGRRAADILEGDPAWDDIAYNIALGLANITALLGPQTIILGGGVGQHLPKYERQLHESMQKLKEKMYDLPEIRQAKHPEEAVVYGCYHIIKDEIDA